MDVVSADEIGTLPDQNVAEAVQRVSGVFMETSRGEGRTVSIRGVAPNLNNVTLNGQPLASTAADRATALDLLPASMVSSIEVIKAVTPDMDANTIGGTVNLRTLTAFDRPGPFFSGSAEGLLHRRQVGYGDRRMPYELDLTAGRRFGASDAFGLVVAGSASRRDNAVAVLDPDGWIHAANKMGGDSLNVSNEIELQVADNDRERYGVTAGLDWRPRPETNVFLRGLYTRTREVERNSEFEITFTGDFEFATPKAGRNSRGSMELDLSQSDEAEHLYSFTLGGGQRWGALSMELSGLVTRGEAESIGPDATFENPRATEPQASLRLDFNPYFFSVTPENPGFVANPANYNLNGLSFNTRRATENTYIGAVDWKLDARLGRFPAFLKFGGKLQVRDKDIDESSERYTNAALTLTPWSVPVVGGLQGAATPFVHGDVDRFVDFVQRNRTGSDSLKLDAVNTSVQAIDNDAFVRERISAGYLMGTTELGRLTVLTGVRAERTESDAEFYELRENSRNPAATRYEFPDSLSTRRNSYTHWLPAVILKLDASKDLVARAAFTSTIGRPQYTQLAGYTRANYLPDLTNPSLFEGTVTANNPDLMPYESTNLDLSAEYYMPTGGQLSVGGFYKRIDNPIYNFSSTERDVTRDGRNFTVLKYSQLRNGEAGTFGGVEFSYAQPLYFLPKPLDGLGITANVALISSELTVAGREERLPFLGQPDRVINLIPYYQRGPFEVRFAYAQRSEYLTAVVSEGLDRFVDSRGTMDLTMRYQLAGPGLELIGTARNLANAPEVRYQGNRSQYDLHVLTGRTFSIGVRTTR
jgi:TonB-dependent receptor